MNAPLLETALKCADRNWYVFPANPDKTPDFNLAPSWKEDSTIDKAIITRWWTLKPNAPICIDCGRSNLTVLDFDFGAVPDIGLPESLEVTTGRGTHYYARGITKQSKIYLNGQKIGDLKSAGGYVIGPNSPHQATGKFYTANNKPLIDVEMISNIISTLTQAPLTDKSRDDGSPITEDRNIFLTSKAGTFRRAGLNKDEILVALTRINEERCEPPLPASEVNTISHSIGSREVGREDILRVGGHLVVDGHSDKTVVADEGQFETIEEEKLPPFPRLSGLLTELADAICPDIPYEFKIMALITHWGLIRSGLDTLENETHLQPRFYTCFIKEPGWGKTAAINEARKICETFAFPHSMSSCDSGPALVDQFADNVWVTTKNEGDATDTKQNSPFARVLLDPDEMTDLFEKSKVTQQGKNSLFSEYLKLFEGNRTGNRTRKLGNKQIDNAHLAILGGATPGGYETMWTGTGGGSTGLQSRFIAITTIQGKMPLKKKASDGLALSVLIPQLKALVALPHRTIRISGQAQAKFNDWWTGKLRDHPSESRVDDMVKRLLIVLGGTNDEPIIDEDLMQQAIWWGDYIIAAREKFNVGDSYSYTQAFEDAIRRAGIKAKYSMTQNDHRRLVNADRRPGGYGPFLQAWKNMIAVGELVLDGVTSRGTNKYKHHA